MKKVLITICSFALSTSALFCQTTQTFALKESGNLSVNAKAGQIVTVSATLQTTQIAGDTANNTLVLALPNGDFTINEHYITRSTSFVAIQENPVISAHLLIDNGDQSATVTFSTAPVRFAQSERDDMALLARLYSRRGLAGETIGTLCNDLHCTVTGDVIAVGAMSEAKRYSDLQRDSDDSRFARIALPRVSLLPTVQALSNVTQAQADAFNGWALNEARQVSAATAMRTAVNRANTAAALNKVGHEQMQLDAAAQNSIELAHLLNMESGLRSILLSAFQSGGFLPITFINSQVGSTESSIAVNGLSQSVTASLSRALFSQDDISFIAGELFCKDPNIITPFLYPNIIISPRVDAAQALAIHDFINIALRFGVPLKQDQAVEAAGSLEGTDGTTVFNIEVHVDASGQPFGSFNLASGPRNGAATFTLQSNTIDHAVVLGHTFLTTGTFVAADGTIQTFFLSGNAESRSVTIGTSGKFNAAGVLNDGTVKIRHRDSDSN